MDRIYQNYIARHTPRIQSKKTWNKKTRSQSQLLRIWGVPVSQEHSIGLLYCIVCRRVAGPFYDKTNASGGNEVVANPVARADVCCLLSHHVFCVINPPMIDFLLLFSRRNGEEFLKD